MLYKNTSTVIGALSHALLPFVYRLTWASCLLNLLDKDIFFSCCPPSLSGLILLKVLETLVSLIEAALRLSPSMNRLGKMYMKTYSGRGHSLANLRVLYGQMKCHCLIRTLIGLSMKRGSEFRYMYLPMTS